MMLRRVTLSIAGVACILATLPTWTGCDGAGDGSGGGGGTGAGGQSPACEAFAQAMCGILRTCKLTEQTWSEEYCVSRERLYCEAAFGPLGADAPGEIESYIEVCIQPREGQSCDELATPQVGCGIHGPKAGGEPCSSPFECQSGWCQKNDGEACGQCTAAPAVIGDPCEDSGSCAAQGLYCSTETSTCAAHGGPGDPCGGPVDCALAFACVEGTCGPRLAEGDPCVPSEFRCSLGLSCNSFTEVCEPIAVAHEGEPCGIDEGAGTSFACALDDNCEGGVCVPRVPDGQPCEESAHNCEVFATCSDGVCVTVAEIPACN